jgi:hypothetical protein
MLVLLLQSCVSSERRVSTFMLLTVTAFKEKLQQAGGVERELG